MSIKKEDNENHPFMYDGGAGEEISDEEAIKRAIERNKEMIA